MISTSAPDITPGYPSTGERIGPTWRDVWTALRRTWPDWRTSIEVADLPSVARHGLDPKTIGNLLAAARRAGLLEVRYAMCGYPRVRRGLYRIAVSGQRAGQIGPRPWGSHG